MIALSGPLGAGKTVFAKGLAEGLGLDPRRVASPSFVVACEYALPAGGALARLVHVDAWRLSGADELEDAGLRDWLAPGTLLAVEWADRVPGALPDDRLEVRLAGEGGERVLEIEARGPRAAQTLARGLAQPGEACR